jgi:hypothetical protein
MVGSAFRIPPDGGWARLLGRNGTDGSAGGGTPPEPADVDACATLEPVGSIRNPLTGH